MSASGRTTAGPNASGTTRTGNPVVVAGTSNGGTVDVANVDQWLGGGSQTSMPSAQALVTAAAGMAFDGVGYLPLRTPSTFKQAASAAAGTMPLWTPAAGKKFRLMGFTFTLSGDATQAVAGNMFAGFSDGAAFFAFLFQFYVPAVALNAFGDIVITHVLPGNGYLSAAANNVLNVNLQNALTAGNVRASAYGTEE